VTVVDRIVLDLISLVKQLLVILIIQTVRIIVKGDTTQYNKELSKNTSVKQVILKNM